MKESIVSESVITKKYILIQSNVTAHKVSIIEGTDSEIDSYLEDNYDINPTDRFSLMTASSYTYEKRVSDMEISEMVEVDRETTIMRLA